MTPKFRWFNPKSTDFSLKQLSYTHLQKAKCSGFREYLLGLQKQRVLLGRKGSFQGVLSTLPIGYRACTATREPSVQRTTCPSSPARVLRRSCLCTKSGPLSQPHTTPLNLTPSPPRALRSGELCDTPAPSRLQARLKVSSGSLTSVQKVYYNCSDGHSY